MNITKAINGITHLFPDINILTYSAEGFYRTSEQLREKGIVICSFCGNITSDSRRDCEECGDQLMYISPRIELNDERVRTDGLLRHAKPMYESTTGLARKPIPDRSKLPCSAKSRKKIQNKRP